MSDLAAVDAEVEIVWADVVGDAPVALSTQGDLLAVAGATGMVQVFDAKTGSVLDTVEMPGGALQVAIAPDAQAMVVTGPTGYAWWRRDGSRTQIVETGEWSSTATWANNTVVAVASGRRALVLDREGHQRWATEPAASTVTDLAWIRDGRRLAVSAYGAVRCYERHQDSPVMVYPYVGSHLAIAVASTGRWICSGNQDASIHIWRARDGSELTMSGYRSKVSRLAFDDTGRWLAADGAPDVTVWDFAGSGPDGTTPRLLRAHGKITALAWRPGRDGQLASGGAEGNVALWRVAAATPSVPYAAGTVLPGEGNVTGLTWIGRDLLVVTRYDGQVQVFRLPP